MSKLAKAIDATLTGNVKASRDLGLRYVDVSKAVQDNPVRLAREFLLSVKLSKRVFIEEHHDTNIVLHDIKRAMIEEVFGEFRPMLIEMRSALYDEDLVRARTLLAEMEHSMFRDGL